MFLSECWCLLGELVFSHRELTIIRSHLLLSRELFQKTRAANAGALLTDLSWLIPSLLLDYLTALPKQGCYRVRILGFPG